MNAIVVWKNICCYNFKFLFVIIYYILVLMLLTDCIGKRMLMSLTELGCLNYHQNMAHQDLKR